MAKKKSKQKDNEIRMMFVIGAGLVLIGIATFIFLAKTPDTSATQTASSLSTTPMEVNYKAPELTLKNVNGKSESLADYRDKIVLVNNWATWCPPCKAEIPTLISFYEAHKTNGFVIIGIEAGEPQSDVSQFAQEHGMTYPVWFDLGGAAMRAFKNENLPSSYVIDKKGMVRLAWVGEISREMLEKYVSPLLTEN
jgi:peroxiredoxin